MSARPTQLISAISLGLLLCAATADAGKLYKWVDENGNVTYSDQVPPDQVQHAREELNKDGITVKEVTQALSAEEQAAVYRAEEEARLVALSAEEARRRDKALLDSYAGEGDLTRAYSQRVDLLEQTIEAREVEIGLREKGMIKLVAQAAETERAGRAVPEALKQLIDGERQEIDRQLAFVEEKKVELIQSKGDYERDMARYREVAARYANSKGAQ